MTDLALHELGPAGPIAGGPGMTTRRLCLPGEIEQAGTGFPLVHLVYWMFADGEVIYVGRSKNFAQRWRQHRTSSPWLPMVDLVGLDLYETGDAATAAEERTIWAMHPTFNKRGVPRRKQAA